MASRNPNGAVSPPNNTKLLTYLQDCRRLIQNLKSERFRREFKEKTATSLSELVQRTPILLPSQITVDIPVSGDQTGAGPSDPRPGVTEVRKAITNLFLDLLPILARISRGLHPVFLIISILPSGMTTISTAANIHPQVRSLIYDNVADLRELLIRITANLDDRIGLSDVEKLRRKVSGPLWHDRSLRDLITELDDAWERFDKFWKVLAEENKFVVKKLKQYHERSGFYVKMFKWAQERARLPSLDKLNELVKSSNGYGSREAEESKRQQVNYSGGGFYTELGPGFPDDAIAEIRQKPAPELAWMLLRLATDEKERSFYGLHSLPKYLCSGEGLEVGGYLFSYIYQLYPGFEATYIEDSGADEPRGEQKPKVEPPPPPGHTTLHSILAANTNNIRPSPPSERVKMALELAKAVFVLNSAGFVHKSIWPGYIFLEPSATWTGALDENSLMEGQLQRYKEVQRMGDSRNLPMPVLAGFIESRVVQYRSAGDGTSAKWGKLYVHHSRQQGGRLASRRFTILDDAYALGIVLIEIALWEALLRKDSDHGAYTIDMKYLKPNFSHPNGDEEIVDGEIRWIHPLSRLTQGRVRMLLGETYAGVVDWCLHRVDNTTKYGGDDGYSVHGEDVRTMDPDERLSGEFIRNVLLPLESITI